MTSNMEIIDQERGPTEFRGLKSTPCILASTHDRRHRQCILSWTWALSSATMVSRVQTDMAAGRGPLVSVAIEMQMMTPLRRRNS